MGTDDAVHSQFFQVLQILDFGGYHSRQLVLRKVPAIIV